MKDDVLQQYAAMHKNDPYIFPLAFQESQNRQRLRMSQQGAQGMQPQPKVNEQALAQMAPPQAQPMPEDVGIGALPAGNMQFAAEGGIMGYDDANFAARSEPVVMMAGGGVARYQVGGNTMGMPSLEQQDLTAQAAEITDAMVAEQKNKAATIAQLEQKLAFLTNAGAPQAAEVRAQLDALKASGAPPKPTPKPADASFRRQEDPRMKPGVAATAQPLTTSGAAPRADTTRRPAPAAGLGAAAAAAAPKDDPFSMATIRKAQTEAMGDSNYKIGELNNQLVDIRNRAETQVQQRLEDRKKEIESEGDVYKDRSDRLVERAKGLAGQKDQNTGLALLNAGLAIMSTPGGLMTAIGKGAQVGTAQYAAGIKDLRAAQERLDEANDRISELRMNRKDLNNREIRALEKDRDSAILDGQKMIFGFAKDIYGMDRKQAEAAFTSYMSGQEKKATIDAERENTLTRERGANARNKASTDAALQSPERMAFMSALEKTKTKANPQGDAAAAYQSVVAMKREPVSMEKLRGDWLDPAKRMQIAQDYPNVKTFDDYAVVMGAGGGGGAGGDGLRVVGVR
jgi:hypothetical protein